MRKRLKLTILLIVSCWIVFPETCSSQENLRIPVYDAGVFEPDRGPAEIEYTIEKDAARVEVLVEDFRGQIVERMDFIDLRTGEHMLMWGGLDERGERMADGRYRFNIRVYFQDGSFEEERIEIRIATMPEKRDRVPPEPLPPRKYIYKLDGRASTFWRKNTEDEDDPLESGEHRARVHLNLKGKNQTADGVFAVRRPYHHGHSIYDSSSAMGEQWWAGGRLKGVFRRGLGNFNDPMKLYSDFRSERKKGGTRVDQTYGWLNLSALGVCAEGSVDSKERGVAGRMTFGPPKGWRMGVSATKRRAVPYSEDAYRDNTAMSGDFMVPILDGLSLLGECAFTENIDKEHDGGCLLRTEYDQGALRASASYINLGEHFEAAFADPARHVRGDAHGAELDVDYMSRETLWLIKNMAFSSRFLGLKRHNSKEHIYEGDVSLRFKVGDRDNIFISWLGREENGYRSNSLLCHVRHWWSKSWSSGFNGSMFRTGTSHTWRGMVDTTYRDGPDFYRVDLERIRRVIDISTDSPYVETALGFNVRHGPWKALVKARHNRRDDDSGTNFFSKVSYRCAFLHRYAAEAYISAGDRAAFETEKQIEIGIEFRF